MDRDKDPRRERLRELFKARDEDRAFSPPFPTALGEAAAHADAWLLDDSVAVRRGLGLAADFQVPNAVRVSSPKDALNELIGQSSHAGIDLRGALAAIARLVEPSRCAHAEETGFHALTEEVRRELGPLASPCTDGRGCGGACDHPHDNPEGTL